MASDSTAKAAFNKKTYWIWSMGGMVALICLYYLIHFFNIHIGTENVPAAPYTNLTLQGKIIPHTKFIRTLRFIFDWVGVGMAVWISAACGFYYQIKKIPVFGVFAVAFLGIACVNAFHFMIIERVIFVNFPYLWSEFSWWINRLYISIVFLVAIVLGSAFSNFGIHSRRGTLLATGILIFGIAIFAISNGLSIERVPRGFFQRSVFRITFEMIPLVTFIFLSYPLYTTFVKKDVSYFIYFLFISLVPQVASEIYVIFDPKVHYMSSLNLSHLLELYGFALPLLGIIFDNKFNAENPLTPPKITPAVYQSENYFLASLSLQLRNPIHAILGHSAYLAEEANSSLNEKQRSSVFSIERCAGKVAHLINEFIDLSRMRKGSLIFSSEKCSINTLLKSFCEAQRRSVEEKGLQFVVEIEEKPKYAFVDPMRLKQTVYQLISNAIKYTDEGKVILRMYEKEKMIYIEVEDTGIGIAQEQISEIMKPFSQIYTYKVIKKFGIGLGLSIANRVISEMGGSLQCASEEGKGSKFTITLTSQIEEKITNGE